MQNLLVILIVAASAVYLAVRSWRAVTGRREAGCGGCDANCETPTSSTVPLELHQEKAGASNVPTEANR